MYKEGPSTTTAKGLFPCAGPLNLETKKKTPSPPRLVERGWRWLDGVIRGLGQLVIEPADHDVYVAHVDYADVRLDVAVVPDIRG